ncbi:MAG: S8 family peptidase [Anaeromyxobacteraceae bacterium]
MTRREAMALVGALALASACAATRAPPAPAPASGGEAPKQLRARQVIVALAGDDAARAASLKAALSHEYGLALTGSFPLTSIGVECVVFEVAPGRSLPEVVARLARDPRVALAEENQLFRGQAAPPEAGAGSLAYGAALIHADRAQRTRTGRGIRVAVIDTGVSRSHPALRGRLAGSRSFVDGGDASFDEDRHGTAIAGVIAAAGNARVGGIAPGAEVLALKACWYAPGGDGTARCSSWTLAKALDFAIGAGAQVLNLSLSGPPDALLARLLARAHERGVLAVAAAAEEGDAPGFPASLPTVLAVLATDDRGAVRLPAWAATTPALAAPGVDILTTVPGGGWDFLSGSSLAAAHVSGVVALLLEERPRLGADEALALLRGTAQPGPARGQAPAQGVALVDACAALAQLMALPTCP